MPSNNHSSTNIKPVTKNTEDKRFTIFIGCIPGQTRAEDLIKAYGHIGEIFNINLKKKNNKAGSGYGTFCTKSTELFKYLTSSPQQLLGRDITCRQYLSGEEKRKYLASLHNRRVFIKKLNLSWSDEKIFEIFKDFGNIERAYAIRTSSGDSKGFGYVNFACYEDAKAALERQQFLFEGTTIEIHAYFKSKDYVPVSNKKEGKLSYGSGSTDSNNRNSPQQSNRRAKKELNNRRGKRSKAGRPNNYEQRASQWNQRGLDQPRAVHNVNNAPKKRWRPSLDFDTKEPLKCSEIASRENQCSNERNHYYRNLRMNKSFSLTIKRQQPFSRYPSSRYPLHC